MLPKIYPLHFWRGSLVVVAAVVVVEGLGD